MMKHILKSGYKLRAVVVRAAKFGVVYIEVDGGTRFG